METKPLISYDHFSKLDLRIAKVIEAERIEKSEKLVKLQIEIGDERRQIVAGVGKAYQPEDLIGRQIVILANLEPRDLMGETSNGMLLAASIDNQPVLLKPEKEVETGSIIK